MPPRLLLACPPRQQREVLGHRWGVIGDDCACVVPLSTPPSSTAYLCTHMRDASEIWGCPQEGYEDWLGSCKSFGDQR